MGVLKTEIKSKRPSMVLLIFIYIAVVVACTVSHKFNNGTRKESDQNRDVTTKTSQKTITNETEDDKHFTERVIGLTDRAHRIPEFIFQEPKVEYAEPFMNETTKNRTHQSLPEDQSNSKLKTPRMENKDDVKSNPSGDSTQISQTDETDSLESLPSEHIRTLDPVQRANRGKPKTSNETEVETRSLGVWKLPVEFIGFDIANHQSLNVVKPAAIVESRSFITKPEISNVRLNYVVPRANEQEANKQVVPEKNNLRRQQYSDESYSSAENSAEGPSSGVYTETKHDFGKLLDQDYRMQIERAAEELIKKQKQENKTKTDSTEPNHRAPPTRYQQKEVYDDNQNSFQAPYENNNPYNSGYREPQIYSKPQDVHSNENKEPNVYSEPHEYNNGNREPQTYPKPENVHYTNREPQVYNQPENVHYTNKEPHVYNQPENVHYTNKEPHVYNQPENVHYTNRKPHVYNQPGNVYNRNKSPQIHSHPESEHDIENKSPEIFVQQPPDSTLFAFKGFEALFPGLFGDNRESNSPSINNQRPRNLPTPHQSSNYKTEPLYLKEEYPEKYSDAPNRPVLDTDRHPEPPVRNYKQISRPISEEQYRELVPQNEEQYRELTPQSEEQYRELAPESEEQYREPRPFQEQRPESLPVYKEHFQRPLRTNEEQYQKPLSEENYNKWQPVKEEYREIRPNNEKHHLSPPYPPREHILKDPNQFNSDSSEEDTDCSLEQTDINETPKLVRKPLPREPVPQQKLNINHPVVIKSLHNSFQHPKEHAHHSYNSNLDSYEEHSPPRPISEHKNINHPVHPPNIPVEAYHQPPVSAEKDFEGNASPESYEYERKHKYHITVFNHDESSYHKHTPNVPYEPVKTNNDFTPEPPVHSKETPNEIPHDENSDLIAPHERTRHIKFEHGFRPMIPAYLSQTNHPDCHGHRIPDSYQSNTNNVPLPQFEEKYSNEARTVPSDNPEGSMYLQKETPNSEQKIPRPQILQTDLNLNNLPSPPHQESHQEMPRFPAHISRPSYHPTESNRHRNHHNKQSNIAVPTSHIQYNGYANPDRYGEQPKHDLDRSPKSSFHHRDYETSTEPDNEVFRKKKLQSKRRSSKQFPGRPKRKNRKTTKKPVKKSKKQRRSTNEDMKTAAATYHWGMENHKDKDGFFLYANIPRDDAYEYGYRMGGPEQLVERHHRKQGQRSTIKLNWEDKNGDSGDQYWEFNHDSSEGEEKKPKKQTSDSDESI
ncbi:uncharacterized protein TNCT_27181 [Trichonephila clavata]|uniref:Uncharacterized protein n=1 Tax=Trichonephila clavata TaxID=2740835 RepID=A0A8X6K962_TRICU|nr:uncharacterized protein TNCT_27181 [Trichonephila clavata]